MEYIFIFWSHECLVSKSDVPILNRALADGKRQAQDELENKQ